jgi:putative tryptophan/tyrosine transport system substrate-binding protein
MQRREFIMLLGGAAVAWPLCASARTSAKLWRIGFLSGSSRENVAQTGLASAFVQGMREQGYTEGTNFLIEWRFAEGRYDVLPKLAAELVELKVDVIVLGTPAAVRPVQQATSTIPIVMAYSVDPVGSGFVASLAHPGGNTTGLASSLDETVAKQMELMGAVVPGLTRIGLVSNPGNRHASAISTAEASARTAGLALVSVNATNSQGLADAFSTLVKERTGAAIVLSDAFFNTERRLIAELALSNRVPTMFSQRDYAADGGLMSYGEALSQFFRRAAFYVDKLIKGAKPGDLPVEQPTRFLLVINLTTAKALGLTIPPSLLARADEVIE